MKRGRFLALSLGVSLLASSRLFGAPAAFLDYTGTLGAVPGNTGFPTNVLFQTTGFNVAVDSANSGDWKLSLNSIAFDQFQGVIIPAAYPTFGPDHIGISGMPGRAFIEVAGRFTEFGASPTFANGWLALTDISGGGTEANFDLGFMYFPHSENWIASSVSSAGAFLAGNTTGVTLIKDPDDPGRFSLSIAGVDSRTSGMLFTVGGDNQTSGNTVATEVLPDGSGWEIISWDQGADFLNNDGDLEADNGAAGTFHFVYVPYDSQNLIGGRIDDDGSVLNGTPGFISSRTSAGTYLIQIPDGLGSFLGPDDGLIIPNVSKGGVRDGAIDPDDNYLETFYNAGAMGWEVRSFDLSGGNIQDTEFVFMFTQYSDELTLVPEPSTAAILCWSSAALLALRRRRSA